MADKIKCICEVLEEIDHFNSISEFERFSNYLDELVKDGDLIIIPVGKYYAGFEENWYKCSLCNNTWRLVHPDFPFKGFWNKIDSKSAYE